VEFGTWALYAAAAVGLSLTPGPNGLLALTHGALYGTKKTLATIFGGLLGFAAVIGMAGKGTILTSPNCRMCQDMNSPALFLKLAQMLRTGKSEIE
jgi:threonine/homoserine/homoserine lactone efflux protein